MEPHSLVLRYDPMPQTTPEIGLSRQVRLTEYNPAAFVCV